MPVILTERVEFGRVRIPSRATPINKFYVSLDQLEKNPFSVANNNKIEFFVIEIRNEKNKLVKRFKPIKRMETNNLGFHISAFKGQASCIFFSEEEVSQLNLGNNYQISILISKVDGNSIFPFELKPIGIGSERIIEGFSEIENKLLTLVIENETLNEALSYLFDSNSRLEENDIEGARVSLRKGLEAIVNNFIPNIIEVEEEPSDYQENLKRLVKALTKFVQYGGAHRGPSPRTTTEMIIQITADIVEYFARCLQNRMIKVSENATIH